jgi:hypothetical protein
LCPSSKNFVAVGFDLVKIHLILVFSNAGHGAPVISSEAAVLAPNMTGACWARRSAILRLLLFWSCTPCKPVCTGLDHRLHHRMQPVRVVSSECRSSLSVFSLRAHRVLRPREPCSRSPLPKSTGAPPVVALITVSREVRARFASPREHRCR